MLGDLGQLAANHAVEEHHPELEPLSTHPPMEEVLVMPLLRQPLAMFNHALLTVLYLIGEYGANVPSTVEEDPLPDQEQSSPQPHLVDVHAQV